MEDLPTIPISYDREFPSRDFLLKERTFTARMMVPADYPQVRKLLPAVSTCNGVLKDEDVAKLLTMRLYIPCVVVEKGIDNVVGFAELCKMPHLARKIDGRLERVVVDESVRGCGVGTELCKYVIDLARHSGLGRIDLTAEKESAQYLYREKLGFKHKPTSVFRLEL